MIHFLGTSFAPQHLKAAAIKRGVPVTENIDEADLIFVSEDSPVAEDGRRDLEPIVALLEIANATGKPIVLTSQVTPGFTRSLGIRHIWHQAETLRVKDAEERALNPEQIIVGGIAPIPQVYIDYLNAFPCPVVSVDWETAEFSKIAINMFLAAQVDITNRLSVAAKKVGADWENIKEILKHDQRIGPHAYLTPGRWQDSLHLLRDYHTLMSIK